MVTISFKNFGFILMQYFLNRSLPIIKLSHITFLSTVKRFNLDPLNGHVYYILFINMYSAEAEPN